MFSTCYRQLHVLDYNPLDILVYYSFWPQYHRVEGYSPVINNCVGCYLPIVLATSNYSNFKCFPTALMMEYSFHT